MLTLYDYFRSSACYRVRIALNLKELDYKTVPINLVNEGGEQYSRDYRVLNPQSLVPTLCDDDKVLTQSLAIMEYLEEIHPDPSLLPQGAVARAYVRSLALIIVAEMHPLNNLRVRKYLSEILKTTDAQSDAWYQHWIHNGFTALEKKLQSSPWVGEYCYGNAPTIADICLVPQVANAQRFECEMHDYPIITRINATCLQHPAFLQAQMLEPR